MKSVKRIVTAIGYLQQHPGARLDDVAAELGVHKSNASRLLKSLEEAGWVSRDSTGSNHRIGPALIAVAQGAIDQFALSDQLIPMMQALRDVSGETVHLAVLDNGEMLHIRRVESQHVIRVACPPGTRDRLHCTALGKAYLAGLPAAELPSVVARLSLERRTPNTITGRAALLADIRNARNRGYAIDDEEGRAGVRCVGFAVLDPTGRPVGTISVTGPAARWTPRAVDRVIGKLTAIVSAGAEAAGLRHLNGKSARRSASRHVAARTLGCAPRGRATPHAAAPTPEREWLTR